MSSNRKELKKTLKGPDKFQSSIAGAMDWVGKNKNHVVFLVAPIVLTFVGVWGYQQYTASARADRIEAFGKIETQFRSELEKAEEQRDELREQLTDLDGEIAKAKGDEKKALETKRDDLNKQIAAIEPDHKESAAMYVQFYEANSTHPQGWAAGMKAIAAVLERGEFARAKELLEGILANSTSSPFYQVQARITLINSLEQLKQYEEALKVSDELVKLADDSLQPTILLTRGRLLMSLNKTEDAKKQFDEIVSKYGASQEASRARTMSAILNG